MEVLMLLTMFERLLFSFLKPFAEMFSSFWKLVFLTMSTTVFGLMLVLGVMPFWFGFTVIGFFSLLVATTLSLFAYNEEKKGVETEPETGFLTEWLYRVTNIGVPLYVFAYLLARVFG